MTGHKVASGYGACAETYRMLHVTLILNDDEVLVRMMMIINYSHDLNK